MLSLGHNIRGLRLATMLTVALVFTGCDKIKDLPVGKQYTAKHLCSYVFNSGVDQTTAARQFIAPKVDPFPLIWDLEVNEEAKTVTVGDRIFLNEKLKGRAIHREHMGCTLLLDKDPADVAAHTVVPLTPTPLPADQPWPLGKAGIDTSELPALDPQAMDAALELAFQEPGTYPLNTTSLLVAHNGKLIAERYGMGTHKDTQWMGWSMTKTLTVTMLGILWDQGGIELDAPAPIPAWQGTEKEGITLRNIIHMASGLAFEEEYGSTSGVTEMLYQATDQSAYAAGRPLLAEPGTRFNYSTGDTMLLAKIVQDQTGGSTQHAYDFFQSQLFHPVGIHSALIEVDASGLFVGGAYGYMTPRDWLRMGQLYLQQGNWQGRQIVSPDWIEFVTEPSPSADYYGGQLWLNHRHAEWPQVPEDAFFFAGHQGQRMVVIPSEKLVILRTGVTESFHEGAPADYLNLGPTMAAIIQVVRDARDAP